MDAAFLIVRSCVGDYWQCRVRDLGSGAEDSVDRFHTLAEAQAAWDRLAGQMQARSERPKS